MRHLVLAVAVLCLIGCQSADKPRLSERRQVDFDKQILRGESYMQIGSYAEAGREFEKAVRIDPNSAKASLLRGIAYFHQEEYSAALSSLKKAEKCAPNDYTILKWLAATHDKLKQYDLAISYYRKGLAFSPPRVEQVDILFALGGTYYRNGQRQECVRVWEQAHKLDPDNKDLERYLKQAKAQAPAETR